MPGTQRKPKDIRTILAKTANYGIRVREKIKGAK